MTLKNKTLSSNAAQRFLASVRETLGFDRVIEMKLWILLVAMTLLFSWAGFHFFGRYGLLVGFFTAVGLDALIYFYDELRVEPRFPATQFEGRDPWGVLRLIREQARKLGFSKAPPVFEVASETPFLFSTGLTSRRFRLYISTGALKRFNEEELRSLVSYELLRFKSGLTRTSTAVCAIADLWLLLANSIDAVFLLRVFLRRTPRRWRIGPLTWLSLPLVSLLLRLVIHRSTILEIDRQVAELTKDRTYSEALVKLDSYNKTLPLDVSAAEAAHFTVSPLAKYSWSQWASVQPPVASRVRALIGQYPI